MNIVEKIGKPKSLNEAGIPGVLDTLQTEWDTLVLEAHKLRKDLDSNRKTLANTLYQHDAACRVIARLMKERDEARQALAMTQDKLADYKDKFINNNLKEESKSKDNVENYEDQYEQENCGIYPELNTKMTELSQNLFAVRKTKKKPDNYYKSTDFNNLKENGRYPLHSSSSPGVLSLDINRAECNFVCTGGNDGKVVVFDWNSRNVVSSLINQNNNSSVLGVEFTSNGILLTRSDGMVEYWTVDLYSESWDLKRQIKGTEGIISKVHPLHPYFIYSSSINSWGMFNMETGSKLVQVDLENNEELSCVTVHPDGLMMATGSNNGVIRLWDIRSQTVAATLEEHKGPVKNLRFSEKAIHLISSAENENTPLLWNLKKLNKSPPHKLIHSSSSKINSIDFDPFGSYIISACDKNLWIFETSNPEMMIHEFEAHEDTINAVKFSMDGNYIATGSQDRFLKIFSI